MIIKQTFSVIGSNNKTMLTDLTSDSNNLKAPLIIFVHGFKGFKDWGTHHLVAEFFAENGFRFLKFNFSHNGTTPDHPIDFTDLGAFSDNTFTKEFYDLDQIITYACSGKDFRATEEIYLIGHSRGGGISIIQAANDERIKKLVTWASIAEFNSLWKADQLKEWREKGVIYTFNTRTKQNTPLKVDLLYDLEHHPNEYNIKKAAQRITKPWLIIQGERDINVLPEHAQMLKDECPNAELEIIAGADHVFGAFHPYTETELPDALQEVCDKTLEFFKK
ncbi:MAG: alpha/beta fold hydrolase [Daejeonella sp.]